MSRTQPSVAVSPLRYEPLPTAALQHHQAGRLDQAEAYYIKVLADTPRHPDALHLLGVVAYQTGRYALAADLLGMAVAESPNAAIMHSNLGNALRELSRLRLAVTALQRATALDPASADYRYNLALALRASDRLADAETQCRIAVMLRPLFPEAHDMLGAVLREQGRADEAVACHLTALSLRPGFLNAMCNLGAAFREEGRLGEAADQLSAALAIDHGHVESHYNLGVVVQQSGRPAEAAACYRRAIAGRPEFAEAHFSLAISLLLQGQMAEGWREYEWRWGTPDFARVRREFSQPLWKGEAGGGRTLLVHAEQGLGDTLQFCRYVSLAEACGFKVVVEVQPPLAGLLRCLPGAAAVIAHGDELPPFDVHCPMLSLPLALGTTAETVPWPGSYVDPDQAGTEAVRDRLEPLTGDRLRVGLAWSGAPAMKADRRRSVRPDLLTALLGVPDVAFVSLQKAGPPLPDGFPVIDFMDGVRDFADTAALVANLDLVVSVDTAVAHLAAAMSKRVWLLSRFDPCWRWLQGRDDTPWYPTMRVYRQPSPGDWAAVLAEVHRDLAGA